MSNKLTKIGKSTLSLILCLTMLLTTFCFFDIGSVISEAMVSVGNHPLAVAGHSGTTKTFSKYSINMPELVYIQPGEKTSQYFLNTKSDGTVGDVTSSTGSFSFSCSTAKSIKISYALYDTNLNGVVSTNSVTGVSFTDGTSTSNGSVYVAASSLSKSIKAITMNKWENGKEYILRWTIVYSTLGGKEYTTYAYTGIKFPLLDQAGMTTRAYYYGTSGSLANNPVESSDYSFITGVDSVAGGNVGSNYVNTSTSSGALTAPLVKFDSSIYPRDMAAPVNSSYFNQNGKGVVIGYADRKEGVYFGQGSRIYNTPWDDTSGTKKKVVYNPMEMIPSGKIDNRTYFGGKPYTPGTNETKDIAKYDDYGYGIANITIDTSRYSDLSQVPNLKAGFVQFDSDGGEDNNYLNVIRNCSYTNFDAADYFRNAETTALTAGSQNTAATIWCPEVNRGNVKNDRVWTRGLYSFSGNLTTIKSNLSKSTSNSKTLTIAEYDGGSNLYTTYIRFEYSNRWDPWVGSKEYCSNVATVKLNATLANKSTARKYYYQFLNSGVNTTASNWSTIESYVKSYVKSLSFPKFSM